MAEQKEPLTWNEAIRLCVDIKKKDADRRDSVVAREAEIAAAMGGTDDDGPDSLADHKQRLGTMSARLAAAESEVRRLLRVIDASPRGNCTYESDDGQLYTIVIGRVGGRHVSRVALVPIDELEDSDAD